jgi:drug/metabolite transporter (DMT)-like permease
MTSRVVFALLMGAVLGATGQILFKLGASGRINLSSFINVQIVTGFILYGIGAAFWIWALSKESLAVVYPFTVLTFVLVYSASAFLLGERFSLLGWAGVGLVLVGLLLISQAGDH